MARGPSPSSPASKSPPPPKVPRDFGLVSSADIAAVVDLDEGHDEEVIDVGDAPDGKPGMVGGKWQMFGSRGRER